MPTRNRIVEKPSEVPPELPPLDEVAAVAAFGLGDADEILEVVGPGAHHLGADVEDMRRLASRISDALPRPSGALDDDAVDPLAREIRRNHRPREPATDDRDRVGPVRCHSPTIAPDGPRLLAAA